MVKVKMKGKKRKYVTTAKSGSGSRNAKTRKGRKVNGDVQEDKLNVKGACVENSVLPLLRDAIAYPRTPLSLFFGNCGNSR